MSKSTLVKKTLLSLSIAAMMAGAQSALAYEAGDIILRGGAAVVDPNESSSPISVDSVQAVPGASGLAGNAKVGVGSDTQLGLTLSYMYSSNFGIELLAATPFTHDIAGAGDIAGIGKLAETTHLPPTLTANYYFNEPSADFQPYIGAGINYTIFFSEEVTPTLDNAGTIDALAGLALGTPAGTVTSASGTNIDLNDSWGLAIHMGFDYKLTEDIGLNVAYWNINIDTTAEITSETNLGQVKAHVDVDIDPSVYMAGIYYKF